MEALDAAGTRAFGSATAPPVAGREPLTEDTGREAEQLVGIAADLGKTADGLEVRLAETLAVLVSTAGTYRWSRYAFGDRSCLQGDVHAICRFGGDADILH